MKRLKITFCTLILSVALLFSLVGCGSYKRVLEEKILKKQIDSFFEAVEERNVHKIRSLFSKNVIEKDTDLQEQIEKLLSLYNGGEFEILCDYNVSGSYYNGEEGFTSWCVTAFPVSCGAERYWLSVAFTYEDDIDEDNIGFESVYFYTLDEYCAYYHSTEETHNAPGLLVFAERELENEVRIIERFPYEYTNIDRKLYSANIEAFLGRNKNFDDFVKNFGEPNAESDGSMYFYEVIDRDGSNAYIKLAVLEDKKIEYADVCTEFDYVRSIFEDFSE